MTDVRNRDERDRPFEIEGRRVFPAQGRIEIDGEAVEVEPRILAVLVELAAEHGQIVRREELFKRVWDDRPGADQSLNNAISLLRKVLRDTDAEARLIRTVPKKGYQLLAPVRFLDDVLPADAPEQPGEERSAWRNRVSLIAALAAALVIAVFFWPGRDVPLKDADPQSIAVLPFANLTDDPEYGYFADGLAAEILQALSQVQSLTVVPRSSAFQLRDSGATVSEFARELGVANVLEGSVRLEGDQLRINAQLISAADDRLIWSGSYDRSADSVLRIQRDIAVSIADALAEEMPTTERDLLAALPTEDVEAYEYYLLGNHELRRWTPEGNRRAVQLLERAVELDSEFAEARLALGRAYYFAGTHYGWMSPEEAIPKVKASVIYGASAASPVTRSAALSIYGDVLAWSDHDWDGAIIAYRRAWELSDTPPAGLGLTYSILAEHDAAIDVFDRLVDAGSSDLHIIDDIGMHNNRAWAYFNARRYEAALEEAQRVIDEDPAYADAYRVLGRAQLLTGQEHAALDSFDTAARLMNDAPVALSDRAVALARAGRPDEARAILDALLGSDEYVAAPLVAQVYVNLGDAENAMLWLEKGLADGARGVIFLKVNPMYDPIRDDPRFADLLARLNLDQ